MDSTLRRIDSPRKRVGSPLRRIGSLLRRIDSLRRRFPFSGWIFIVNGTITLTDKDGKAVESGAEVEAGSEITVTVKEGFTASYTIGETTTPIATGEKITVTGNVTITAEATAAAENYDVYWTVGDTGVKSVTIAYTPVEGDATELDGVAATEKKITSKAGEKVTITAVAEDGYDLYINDEKSEDGKLELTAAPEAAVAITAKVQTFAVTLNDSAVTGLGFTTRVMNETGKTPITDISALEKGTKIQVTVGGETSFKETPEDYLFTLVDAEGNKYELATAFAVDKALELTLTAELKASVSITLSSTDALANAKVYADGLEVTGTAGTSGTVYKVSEGDDIIITSDELTAGTVLLSVAYTKGTTTLSKDNILGISEAKAVGNTAGVKFTMGTESLSLSAKNVVTAIYATHYEEGLTLTADSATSKNVLLTDTDNRIIYTDGTSTNFTVTGADTVIQVETETDVNGTALITKSDKVTATNKETWVKKAVVLTFDNTQYTVAQPEGSKDTLGAAIATKQGFVPGTKLQLTAKASISNGIIAVETPASGPLTTKSSGANVAGEWAVPKTNTTLIAATKVSFDKDKITATLNGNSLEPDTYVEQDAAVEAKKTSNDKDALVFEVKEGGTTPITNAKNTKAGAALASTVGKDTLTVVPGVKITANMAVTINGDGSVNGTTFSGTDSIGTGVNTNGIYALAGADLYVTVATATDVLALTDGSDATLELSGNKSGSNEVYTLKLGAKDVELVETEDADDLITVKVVLDKAGKTADVQMSRDTLYNISADTSVALLAKLKENSGNDLKDIAAGSGILYKDGSTDKYTATPKAVINDVVSGNSITITFVNEITTAATTTYARTTLDTDGDVYTVDKDVTITSTDVNTYIVEADTKLVIDGKLTIAKSNTADSNYILINGDLEVGDLVVPSGIIIDGPGKLLVNGVEVAKISTMADTTAGEYKDQAADFNGAQNMAITGVTVSGKIPTINVTVKEQIKGTDKPATYAINSDTSLAVGCFLFRISDTSVSDAKTIGFSGGDKVETPPATNVSTSTLTGADNYLAWRTQEQITAGSTRNFYLFWWKTAPTPGTDRKVASNTADYTTIVSVTYTATAAAST